MNRFDSFCRRWWRCVQRITENSHFSMLWQTHCWAHICAHGSELILGTFWMDLHFRDVNYFFIRLLTREFHQLHVYVFLDYFIVWCECWQFQCYNLILKEKVKEFQCSATYLLQNSNGKYGRICNLRCCRIFAALAQFLSQNIFFWIGMLIMQCIAFRFASFLASFPDSFRSPCYVFNREHLVTCIYLHYLFRLPYKHLL